MGYYNLKDVYYMYPKLHVRVVKKITSSRSIEGERKEGKETMGEVTVG